jgi:crotonobetainyl-CoA:carnitine CoA-transferase CaiB-like acyl-CoA transferase
LRIFRLNYDDLWTELQIDAGEALAQAFHSPNVLRERLDALFKTKTRDEWMDELKGARTHARPYMDTILFRTDFDVCVTPVLDCDEVGDHAQNKARNSFVRDTRTGRWLPQAAPRLMVDYPVVKCPIQQTSTICNLFRTRPPSSRPNGVV